MKLKSKFKYFLKIYNHFVQIITKGKFSFGVAPFMRDIQVYAMYCD